MYMRVVRGRTDPARLDELTGQVGQDVGAAIRRLPGFQSHLGGVDRASGRTVAISTWDTEEHARWPRESAGDLLARFQALGIQLEPPEFFEATTT